jgi:hypothetical protein
MRLTAKTVNTVQLPPGKIEHYEWDDEIQGFAVRLRVGGSRKLTRFEATQDHAGRRHAGSIQGRHP